ncbi:uncharacterized protein LOC119373644 [Rhipicephalus sanguineus]|uniref:uncharacterized protein LOC119373644 n=1 Tax=Rhipicephalus sanguineus TaxID=34632 RepID=UPI001892FEF6|nr:uncharacterized protein LOC119373644 [Rhipicephalus sanguineus]
MTAPVTMGKQTSFSRLSRFRTMPTLQQTDPTSMHSPFAQSEIPKVYNEVHKFVRQSTAKLLETWQASFFTCSKENGASDHQYLEIGCGPGNFTLNHLLPSCPPTLKRLVSTDNSQAMLDHAKTVHAHPKIVYKLLDISKDDDVSRFVAEEGRFQRVYSFLAFHCIEDNAAALRNVERLLTPGGECLVIWKACPSMTVPLHRALLETELGAKYHDVIQRVINTPPEPRGPATLRNHLLSLVEQTGFVPLTCELLTVNIENAAIDDAARLYTAGNIIYHLLTEEEKPKLFKFTKNFLLQEQNSDVSSVASTRQLRFIFHGYKP